MNASTVSTDSISSRFGANSAAVLISQLLNNALASVFAVLFIRHFGREEYGIFSTVFAYLSFFAIFQSLGVEAIMLREASRDRRALDYVADAAGLRLVLSVTGMLLSWCLLPIIHPTQRVVALIVLASLSAPASIYSLYIVPYMARLKMARPNLLFAAWSLLYTALRLGMIAMNLSLEAFIVASIGSDAVVFWIARTLGRGAGVSLRIRLDSSVAWRLLSLSWPIALSSMAMQLLVRIDQIMLFRMKGAAEVGLYAVPVRLVEFANMIPTVFVASAFPLLARLANPADEAPLKSATSMSFRAMACVGLLLATYLLVFPESILRLLFGDEFTEAGTTTRVLSVAMVFSFLNSILLNRLIAANQQRLSAALAAGAALLNVALNIPLIAALGGEGAAIATLISYGSIPIAASFATRRDGVGRMALASLVRPSLAALTALGVVQWWTLDGSHAIAAIVLVYGTVLVLSGEIGAAETRIVSRALNIPWRKSALALL